MSRELFAAAVRTEPVDLGLACALIAREAHPTLDPAEPLAELDALAALARPLLAGVGSGPACGPEVLRV
ncbi:MAG: hypothetical protein ACYDB7_13600, partial [Mycobacteriales bacterium]